MTEPSSKRYEIEETETSPAVARRFPDLAGVKHFRVIDKVTGKAVPFGGYASRAGAERRIARLEARDAG